MPTFAGSHPAIYGLNFVWDTNTLMWVKETQPSGGGGGGAVTIADGADTTEGTIADVKVLGDNAGTISAKLRGINTELAEIATDTDNLANLDVVVSSRLNTLGQKASASSAPVVLANDQSSIPVVSTPANTTASATINQVGFGTQNVDLTITGMNLVTVQIGPAAWTGLASWQVSRDGVNFYEWQGYQVLASGSPVTNKQPFGSTSVSGMQLWRFPVSGWTTFRMNAVINSGTFNATAIGTTLAYTDPAVSAVNIVGADTYGANTAVRVTGPGGALNVYPMGSNGSPMTSVPGDGIGPTAELQNNLVFPELFNGATYDRWYGDKTNGAFVNVKTSVLPTGAALDSSLQSILTDTNDIETSVANLDVALSTRLADATFTGRINTLGQKTMVNSTPVVLSSDQSAIPVTSPAKTSVNTSWNNLTPNFTELSLDVSNYATVAFSCLFNSAPSTGVIAVQGSINGGTTYFTLPAISSDNFSLGEFSTFDASNPNGPRLLVMNCAGLNKVRLILTTVLAVGLTATIVILAGPQATSTITVATQGPSGSNASAWWTQIGDTVVGPTAVKSGSTLPLATDKALVVTQRDALPAGANVIGAVTANAGTNLNTSALALETGGNLAGAKTDLDAILLDTNDIELSTANIDTSTAASKVDLDTLVTRTPVQGQATMANSSPVVIASDQNSVPVTATIASLPLPAGAALESGGNLALMVAMLEYLRSMNMTLAAVNMQLAQLNGSYIDPLDAVSTAMIQ